MSRIKCQLISYVKRGFYNFTLIRLHYTITLFDETQKKNDLLHKLKMADRYHDILEKQLRQAQRNYGDLLLDNSETASEFAESRHEAAGLRAELNHLNSDNNGERHELTRQVAELRLEVKQLRHSMMEANAELEEMRKEAKALEAENRVLRGMGEDAKAAEEKARKERDVAMTEKLKLKRDKDAMIDSATIKAFNSKAETCGNHVKCLMEVKKMLAEISRKEKEEEGEVDFLETARRLGYTFPKPRWMSS